MVTFLWRLARTPHADADADGPGAVLEAGEGVCVCG